MPTATSLPMTCTATMVIGLALGGVDLAGHDGGAGLVFRDADFAQAVARAGGQPAHVVGDLHQVRRQRLERAVGKDELVLAGEGVELVGGGDKVLAGELGDRLARPPRRSPWARSGRCRRRCRPGPAPCRLRQGQLQHLLVLLQRGAPAADLLGEAGWASRPAGGCGRT